jgi:hypothetical protein
MDIVEFLKYLERNDLQNFLTDPKAKNTDKDARKTSAYFRASKEVRDKYGRDLTEEEKDRVFREAERAYNLEMRQKRKAAVKSMAATL